MKIILALLVIGFVYSQLSSQAVKLLSENPAKKDIPIISFPNYTCTSITKLDLPNNLDGDMFGLVCVTDDTFQYHYIEAQLDENNKLRTINFIQLGASLTAQECNDIIQLDEKFLLVGCMNRYNIGINTLNVITVNRDKLTKEQDSFFSGDNEAFGGRIRLRKFQDYLLIYDELDTRLEQNVINNSDNTKKHKLTVFKFPL